MKIKNIILSMLLLLAASFTFAQDTTVVVGEPIVHGEITRIATDWFVEPGIFFLMVILISGMLFKVVNIASGARQFVTWGLGIALGIVGSLAGWGMFEGLSILEASLTGWVSAGGANVLYNTGAFNSILGIAKK